MDRLFVANIWCQLFFQWALFSARWTTRITWAEWTATWTAFWAKERRFSQVSEHYRGSIRYEVWRITLCLSSIGPRKLRFFFGSDDSLIRCWFLGTGISYIVPYLFRLARTGLLIEGSEEKDSGCCEHSRVSRESSIRYRYIFYSSLGTGYRYFTVRGFNF